MQGIQVKYLVQTNALVKVYQGLCRGQNSAGGMGRSDYYQKMSSGHKVEQGRDGGRGKGYITQSRTVHKFKEYSSLSVWEGGTGTEG